MRKIAALLAVLLAFAGAASAFEVSIQPKQLTVRAGGNATFDLIIASGLNETLVVSPKGEQPWVTTPTTVEVLAGIPKVEIVHIQPYIWSKPKIYFVEYGLQSMETVEKKFTNLTVIIRVADINIEKVDIKGSLEPSGFGEASFFVKNLENATVTALLKTAVEDREGSLKLFSNEEALVMEPFEFRILRQRFELPECIPSGEYFLRSTLVSKDADVFYTEDPFAVPAKFATKTTRQEGGTGLRTDVSVTVKNVGNVPGTAEVKENVFGSLFFSGDTPSDTSDGFRWDLALGTCESKTIRYSVDFSPLLAIILLAFALWYIFFRMRTLRLKKIVLQRQVVEKGVEFTIGVDLKTYVKVKDVEVRDFVPALFEVKEAPGIKPIRHKTTAGTELIWRFPMLYPYEERVLAYKIVPGFSVTGHVMLPRSSVSFSYFGRRILRKSDTTGIGLHLMKGAPDLDQSIKEGLGKVRDIPLKFKTSGMSADMTYAQDRLGKKAAEKAEEAKKSFRKMFEKKPETRKKEEKSDSENGDKGTV
jgi:hypothetical protein